jgi:7-cyano-7-deazaguanine synthase
LQWIENYRETTVAKDLAIVLNNGSINSSVITAMAAQKYRPVMVFCDTSVDPGGRRRAAFEQQVAHFKPYREYSVPISSIAGAPMQSNSPVADPRQGSSFAPAMIDLLPMISIAIRLAVQYQAAAIYVGSRVGASPDDLAQFTEYYQILNELIQLPCGQPELDIQTPLLELETWQVVDVGFQVAAPLDKTWSCAEETSEPCWACRGCRAREAAFQQAGKPDPMRAVRKL